MSGYLNYFVSVMDDKGQLAAAEEQCAPEDKIGFQDLDSEITSLKGLEVVNQWIENGDLKDGDVIVIQARYSAPKPRRVSKTRGFMKTDGSVVTTGEAKPTTSAEADDDIPF